MLVITFGKRLIFIKIERKIIMKKRLLALAVGMCMVTSLAACGSDSENEKSQGSIVLGQYKGIKVAESVATVTDEELQDYIDYILESNQTTENVEEGTTKEDDKILAVYTATMDGETVSELSSSSSGTNITLSEDSFAIDGFVDQLIGKNVGESVEFDITIQDDFTNETYRGAAVHYVVDIQAIVVTITPELTDEWVTETYGYLNLSTVDEFKAYYKENLFLNTVYNDIIDEVMENQTVESYDSDELAEMTELYKQEMENQLSYYGIALDAYLQAMGQSEDSFNEEMETQAKDYLKQKMFVYKVAEEEGLTVSDEEYSAKMVEYAKSMGLESESELVSYYDGVMDTDDYKYTMLGEKVQKLICENIEVVPDSELETTGEETTTGAEESETTTGTEEETETTAA